jgi:hypothetical protein
MDDRGGGKQYQQQHKVHTGAETTGQADNGGEISARSSNIHQRG